MKIRQHGRGVGLVEVVVAIALLALGAYGLVTLLDASQRTGERADREMRMSALALARLHELRLDAGRLAGRLDADTTAPLALPADGPAPFEDHPEFAWSATVERDAADPERLNLTVEVTRVAAGDAAEPMILRTVAFVNDAATTEGAR